MKRAGASGPTVAVVGAYDTKAEPLDQLGDLLRQEGCAVHRMDFGAHSERADVETTAETLAKTVEGLTRPGVDRAGHLEVMGEAVGLQLRELLGADGIDAVLFAGGSGAATVFAAAAASLPFGVPKVLVSTIVAGDTRPYLRGLDALLFYPVVDVEGDNRLLRSVLARAAVATAALARQSWRSDPAPVHDTGVAMTMFGITTPCVSAARRALQTSGHEVLTFHANGTGGAAMERLIREGECHAVLDVTTTELADHIVGGALSAGESRLTAAADKSVPQVLVPGAMDTVNYGPLSSVPSHYRGRVLHAHNPHVTLMRTTAEECRELGALLAERAGRAPATTTVAIPRGGLSELDQPGRDFWDPEADAALFDALQVGLDRDARLVESPFHINDPRFADLLVDELVRVCEMS